MIVLAGLKLKQETVESVADVNVETTVGNVTNR